MSLPPLPPVSYVAANRRQSQPSLSLQTSMVDTTNTTAEPSQQEPDDYAKFLLQQQQLQPQYPQQLGRSTSVASAFSSRSGRSGSFSLDSPSPSTTYRDLTPLPSPIVSSTSPVFKYTGRSPPSSSIAARAISTSHLHESTEAPAAVVVSKIRKPYGELQADSLGLGITAVDQQMPGPANHEQAEKLKDLQREKTLTEDTASPGEVFEAYEDAALPKLRWREMRPLGKGTFSRVVLAGLIADASDSDETAHTGKELVAVKIVELAGAGGASRERIESGLKREVDILKNLNHPCLIHLIAFNLEPTRALIILPYCKGGDLFDLATSPSNTDLLNPHVVRRLFAEVVSAVRYLHENNIVHRDIKLENVLLTIDQTAVLSAVDGPTAITTLTDFGLSRRINPESPLLTTRCGSEDYAPPELIMGQPYDGRQTDAWALGVLLYALMEGRFPFDPPPPLPGSSTRKSSNARSRVKHRIARVEWCWVRFRRRDGTEDAYVYDHEPDSSEDDEECADINAWVGAQRIVEQCLRRKDSRASVRQIAESPWLKGALSALNLDE